MSSVKEEIQNLKTVDDALAYLRWNLYVHAGTATTMNSVDLASTYVDKLKEILMEEKEPYTGYTKEVSEDGIVTLTPPVPTVTEADIFAGAKVRAYQKEVYSLLYWPGKGYMFRLPWQNEYTMASDDARTLEEMVAYINAQGWTVVK